MKTMLFVPFFLLAMISASIITVHVSTSRSRAFLRQSEEEIRAYMLELTPIGMSMEEAQSVIQQRFQIDEWGPWDIDYNSGVVRNFNARIHAYPRPAIGVKSINLQLGQYRRRGRLLGFTFVFAGWGFDENSMLVDVHVSKSRPAI